MKYEKELKAIKRSNRYRKRVIFSDSLIDLGSNDYLGFASDKSLLDELYKSVENLVTHAPKASLLVNGYSKVHQDFEIDIAKANGFEDGIVVGSGYLANVALIEALVRRDDLLIMDEYYHASGVMGSNLVQGRVKTFKHNDIDDLKNILSNENANRIIIAIEGVYSMHGDIARSEIYELAREFDAILLVDEAHSSGTIGDNLLGWFDYIKKEPCSDDIKMGTLGKAYGSYGAYILASSHIIEYLENRAKPIIYSTAPSILDIKLAHLSFNKLQNNIEEFKSEINHRKKLANEILGMQVNTPIVAVDMKSNSHVLEVQKRLNEKCIFVGAIRPPTVDSPIIRLILRCGVDINVLKETLEFLASEKVI